MKTKLAFVFLLCVALDSSARIMKLWTYDELRTNATLVVIATPIKVTVTERQGTIGGSSVVGKEIETRFESLTVLKGDLQTNQLVLLHFVPAKPKEALV